MKLSLNEFRPLKRIVGDPRGQTLIEYALLLILIAVVVIAAVTFVGTKTSNLYCTVATSLPS